MIRVLVYDVGDGHRGSLRATVDAVMTDLGVSNLGLTRARSADEMADVVHNAPAGFFDLVVCRIAVDGGDDGVFPVLQRIREEERRSGERHADIVILADSIEHIAEAVQTGVQGYCLEEEGSEGLRNALRPTAMRLMEWRGGTVGLRTDEGVGSVVVDQIMFAESSKRGSLIHLPAGKPLLIRLSLQDLYARLAPKGNFMKTGSSFIVNVDNVRSIGEGAIIFSNGASIIVPVRMRKQAKETVESHWSRKPAAS